MKNTETTRKQLEIVKSAADTLVDEINKLMAYSGDVLCIYSEKWEIIKAVDSIRKKYNEYATALREEEERKRKEREQKEIEQWEQQKNAPREFLLTEDDKELLISWGYLQKDLDQIELEANVCKYEQVFKRKPEKELTREEVIKKIGRKQYLSGISRTAFHWNCCRDRGNICISFESGLLGRNVNDFKY